MTVYALAYGGLALITFLFSYRSFRSTVGEALFIAIVGPGILGLLVLGIVYSSYLF